MPRPTRFFDCLEPAAGFTLLSCIYPSVFSRYETRLIMPRFDGVSITSTVWLRRRSPRPRTHARCSGLVPMRLLTSVTLIVFCPSAIAYPVISSTDLPRFAAMLAGVFIDVSPLMVARTTLYGFVEPRHFERMLA